jgi:hypothetical protein
VTSSRGSYRGLPRPLGEAAACAGARLRRSDQALAITLVEAYLRPLPWRAIEYVYWSLSRICRRTRSGRITLGLCQIRAEFLLECLAREGRKPTLTEILRMGEHVGSAADVAAAFLAIGPRCCSVSRQYTGCFNPYYESLVRGVTEVLVESSPFRDRVA